MASDRGIGWAAVRAAGPAVLIGEAYHLTRREDVLFALRNPDVFSSKEAFDQLGSPLPLVPIAFDPPEHVRYRQILQPFFSPKALTAVMPELQKQAAAIIDAAVSKPECEVMSEIAIPYPSQVFLTLFGLPMQDRDRLIRWKDAIVELMGVPHPDENDLIPAFEMFNYVNGAVAAKREHPGADILSQLLLGDDALEDAEAIGLCYLFVLAGLDTVTSAMGSALLALARDRKLREQLTNDPSQVKVFIEEIVRLEPPAPMVPRVTTKEVTVGETVLPKGSMVRLCLGAINRDDFDEVSTNTVVMDGKVHRHWGFGGGPHRCLGSHLARLELTLITNEWLKRVPYAALKAGFDPQITFPAQAFALASLPLVLEEPSA